MTTDSEQHLYDSDHPYYASESNYFSNECSAEYGSWSEFYEAMGDADDDMNLLFRWDWHKADPAEERETDVLEMFFIGQRKGIYQYHACPVTRDQEPEIRAFLERKWSKLQELWRPFA